MCIYSTINIPRVICAQWEPFSSDCSSPRARLWGSVEVVAPGVGLALGSPWPWGCERFVVRAGATGSSGFSAKHPSVAADPSVCRNSLQGGRAGVVQALQYRSVQPSGGGRRGLRPRVRRVCFDVKIRGLCSPLPAEPWPCFSSARMLGNST